MADQPNRKSAHVKEQAMTYDDYSQLPEDGPRYELVRGELQMLPSASPRHQSVGVRLLHLLVSTCDLDYDVIHEVDVILSST